MQQIYEIKGRPANLPLAICVGDAADVGRYALCEHLPQGLLSALLPGPVTVLLTRRPDAPIAAGLNEGVSTIGVCLHPARNCRHWVQLCMIQACRTVACHGFGASACRPGLALSLAVHCCAFVHLVNARR